MNKEQKKLRDSVFTALDAIYKASETIAFKWDENFGPKTKDLDEWAKEYEKANSIPYDHFAMVIDNAKWPITTDNKAAISRVEKYNKMIDHLYASCYLVAVGYGTGIPLTLIKNNIDAIKQAFNKGLNGKNKAK